MPVFDNERAPLPHILIISGGKESPGEESHVSGLLECLPEHIPCMVQIREKHLMAGSLYNLASSAAKKPRPEGRLLLVNERADIAYAAGLDGVHLPEHACSPSILKAAGFPMICGCSVHSIESARLAEDSGADYLLFGPVFDTPSKRIFGKPQGLEKLETLCRSTTLPVFAVGGITPSNGLFCKENGAWGCAGISLFLDRTSLAETLERLNSIW
ncbi:MAG: thiamine phosphate synthase [Chlorobiaceae bacterium]|nr:thiamine phosphate synthase [Chlorobiaceae bacterium]NTV60516.1 thiamine phosphate synthase [Chlorobiaceae bacterium]